MEQIKQEIINSIYENGENLITGPILQEVLLDMVDDVNSKVASASVAPEIVNKTGSWDDAADWIEENSSSLVHETDLDGYATEQWVEDQGYLKEIPEGYATTESLNELSESVAETIESIPQVDLSGYATTESVNEATESVKDWVEAKHYLTTASLSGSVTEETVGFMINDATASVKEWIEEKNYATETFVSESIAGIDIPDVSGYLPTASFNLVSASFDERINAISGSDLSGYATTASLNALSESLSESIPDVSGFATTSSLEDLESRIESVEGDLAPLTSAKDALEDAGIIEWSEEEEAFTAVPLATSESVSALSESVRSLGNQVNGLGEDLDTLSGTVAGLASTSSLNSLSESVATDLGSLDERVTEVESGKVDWDTYDTERAEFSQSVASDITSLSESIAAISGSDLSGYATTESLNQLSSSVAEELETKVDDEGVYNILAGTGLAEPEYGEWTVYEAAKEDDLREVSSSLSASIAAITGSSVDLSGYATTASLNELSESLENYLPISGGSVTGDLRVEGRLRVGTTSTSTTNSIAVGKGVQTLMEGGVNLGQFNYSASNQLFSIGVGTTQNFKRNAVSVHKDNDQGSSSVYIQGVGDYNGRNPQPGVNDVASVIRAISGSDLSGYATTSSVNQLSSSVANDFANLNIPDVSGYATTSSVNALSASFDERILSASGLTYQDLNDLGLVYEDGEGWTAKYLPEEGEGSFNDEAPAIWHILRNKGLIGVEEDESGWSISYGVGSPEWVDNPIAVFLQSIAGNDNLASYNEETGFWESPIVAEVEELSASVAEMVVPDLSIYATTESLNTVSASFDERINNIITGSGVDLSGYATTASVDSVSQSISQSINTLTGDVTSLSQSVANDFANLNIPDVSGYATTESVNQISASFAETIDNIPTGSGSGGNYLPITGGILTGNLVVSSPHSLGVGTTKIGDRSLSVGNGSTSTEGAHYSVAIGESCKTSIYGGFVAGRENVVESNGAFGAATGFRCRTIAMAGYAGGCRSTASANFATAIGFGAEARSLGQVVLGSYNEYDPTGGREGTGSYAVILANGKSSTWNQDNPGTITRSNGLAIRWDGGIDFNYSGSTITLQDKIAELENSADISGLATTASLNELSESVSGLWKRGAASYSLEQIVEPLKLNSASGTGSLAQGQQTKAEGGYSHAEGFDTWAEGVYSHAEGNDSHASGLAAHAEGYTTLAGGDFSHAEGNLTRAIGNYSHAEGAFTTASKDYSHAEGNYSVASGSSSHAEGNHTVTSNDYEHAEGLYNATASNQIFSVGAGEENSSLGLINRRNALTVLAIPAANGVLTASVFVQGIGGYDGTNPEPGTNDIASVISNLVARIEALEGSN